MSSTATKAGSLSRFMGTVVVGSQRCSICDGSDVANLILTPVDGGREIRVELDGPSQTTLRQHLIGIPKRDPRNLHLDWMYISGKRIVRMISGTAYGGAYEPGP